MKQIIVALILILACPILNAQKVSIGMELGTISSLSKNFSEPKIENIRHTYYTGLNVNYHFNEKLEFATGLHYLRQGYKHSIQYTFLPGVKSELTTKFDYLIVPTALNINIGKANNFSVTAGIYNGLNIKAAQDYSEEATLGLHNDIYYDPDLFDVTEKHLLGGIIGVSYKSNINDKLQIKSNVKY